MIPRKNTDIEPANKVLNSQTSTPNNKAYGKLKDLPNAIWALLTNPTYMMINFGGGADGFCISGLSAFLPKFLQSQYGFSAGIAGAIVGALVIPAGGLGTFRCSSCHIRSVLIAIEYRNWYRTLDVYLLFAILLGQIYKKLNYRLVTYKLTSP